MVNLTDYQKKVVHTMKKFNACLQTTEGHDYKVWMVFPENSKKVTVRKDTANILFKKGYITINEKRQSNYFEYIYTGKKIS